MRTWPSRPVSSLKAWSRFGTDVFVTIVFSFALSVVIATLTGEVPVGGVTLVVCCIGGVAVSTYRLIVALRKKAHRRLATAGTD